MKDTAVRSREEDAADRVRRTAVILLAVILAVAALGFFLVFRFAEANRDRDMAAWRDRLAVVAESRAAAVDDWIGAERDVVATVARNPTIQFFLTELGWTGTLDNVTDGAARLDIIKTYMTFTAEQSGFAAAPTGPAIAANVEQQLRGGLVMTDKDGRPLVSVAGSPNTETIFKAYRAQDSDGRRPYVHDLYLGDSGEPTLAFVAPVFPIDSADGVAVGYVIGIRLVTDELYGRLNLPGDDKAVTETFLLRKTGDHFDYISPLADGSAVLSKRVAATDLDAAAVFAGNSPGEFADKADYAGRRVLVTGESLKTVPWTLVRMIRADQALGEITARRNATLVIFGLIIVAFLGGLLLLWRYGASLRVAALAHRYERLSGFLTDVTDSQPTRILAFDETGVCRFANGPAARAMGAESGQDLVAKSAPSILGPVLGAAIDAANQTALAEDVPLMRTVTVESDDGTAVFKADHVPLDVPLDVTGEQGHRPGVLVVIEDISDLVRERERRENNLRQLVGTLTGVIDSRDPFAARHSRWVGELAEAIAQDMGLSDVEVETAEIAGALLNLGKVLVPRSVLTKSEALSPSEIDLVRQSMLKSAELLQGVDFNGPVVTTIRQSQAHWDGTGLPLGLKGDDILMTARIVAVANAFVGMVSARSHRAAMPLERVIELLLAGVGTLYDRRPVAALVNYLDNHGGRTVWEHRSHESTQTLLG